MPVRLGLLRALALSAAFVRISLPLSPSHSLRLSLSVTSLSHTSLSHSHTRTQIRVPRLQLWPPHHGRGTQRGEWGGREEQCCSHIAKREPLLPKRRWRKPPPPFVFSFFLLTETTQPAVDNSVLLKPLPLPLQVNPFQFLLPFTQDVWLLMFATSVIVGISVLLAEVSSQPASQPRSKQKRKSEKQTNACTRAPASCLAFLLGPGADGFTARRLSILGLLVRGRRVREGSPPASKQREKRKAKFKPLSAHVHLPCGAAGDRRVREGLFLPASRPSSWSHCPYCPEALLPTVLPPRSPSTSSGRTRARPWRST